METETKPIVVNLFAGPGAGKSTIAAQVFSTLKWHGIVAELVTEYAKEKVWDENIRVFDNQFYVFAKQHHKQFRLRDKVQVIVTDSPLLLSMVYGVPDPTFHKLVRERFDSFDNLNFYLIRKKPYVTVGRMQDEAGAREVDEQILDMLKEESISANTVIADGNAADLIVGQIYRQLGIDAPPAVTEIPA